MMTRIRKRILILSLMLFCGGALAGCASNQAGGPGTAGSTADSGAAGTSGNTGDSEASGKAGGSGQSGKTAGSASSGKIDEAKLSGWDHIAMKAAPDTPAAVVEGDAGTIKERLAFYAGEGRYVLEVSEPENAGDSARIDIWLDPSLKGKENLTLTAGTYISAPMRFSVYDNETGYLDLQEDQFLDLAPSDFVRIEETGTADPEITVQFGEAFLAKNRQRLEAWRDRLILIADVRTKETKTWMEGGKASTWLLTATEDPAVFVITPEYLSADQAAFLMENLPKEPLAGTYTAACQPAVSWDEKEVRTLLSETLQKADDPGASATSETAASEATPSEPSSSKSGTLLCTRDELLALGTETVIIPLIQTDPNMDEESRGQLLAGLCSRMDALGNPYCIGELTGQAGTFAIETLPDHINEDVIDILKSAAPFNLAANVYLLNLEGGQADAEVISLEDGSLALDLSLTMGGKDSLYRMSLALEELGGGEISLFLNRHTPLCGADTDTGIPDGHLIFDKNYTGIGGDTWNEQNRWILDLVCAAVNTDFYPAVQPSGAVLNVTEADLFSCLEYCRVNADGELDVPEAEGFTDDAVVSEVLTTLRAVAPAAEITNRSDFAEYEIRLNLDPEAIKGDRKTQYLASVYQMILTGPVINADVYLGAEDTECISFRTYYSKEEITVQEGQYISEEYYDQILEKIYAENPSLKLLEQKMTADLQTIKESMRK